MSDSPKEVLTPTSPQGLGVPITPVVGEVSSIANPDPVKETHREEQKEAAKKPTARRPAGTGSSSAPASGLQPWRTGATSLSRPPQRSTVGISGATSTAGNAATRRTLFESTNSTINNPPATGSRTATTSGISRTPAITPPATNTPRSPKKKKGTVSSSSSLTNPTANRQSHTGGTASTASNVRRAATPTTTPTAPAHRSRPSTSALSNTATAGRASAASTARENFIPPRPPSTAGRPIFAVARGTNGIPHPSFRPSTSTLRSRATGPSGTLSASSATSSKELEALKIKVSDLEEKNKELSEQLSKAGGHPTTDGDAKAATEEIATLKKQIEDAHEASKGASEKNTEALESRQKEIDDLGSAVNVLQEELEKAALESEEAIQELQEKHAAELAEAVNTEKTVTKEAEAKLEKLVPEHREQLEKGSEILSAQLQEAKSAARVLEEDLLQKIEAAKLESAEALETTQKEAAEKIEAVKQEKEAQQKQFELTIEVLKKEASDTVESKDKEWENKIDQLRKSNQEQVNNLTAQLSTAKEEIQEASRQLELVKQKSEAEIKSAQDLLHGKESQLAKREADLEKNFEEMAVRATVSTNYFLCKSQVANIHTNGF